VKQLVLQSLLEECNEGNWEQEKASIRYVLDTFLKH